MDKFYYMNANTPMGDISLLEENLQAFKIQKIYMIKSNKSITSLNIIKNLGEKIKSDGYDVEYIARTENDNFIGLIVPTLYIAILDNITVKSSTAFEHIIDLNKYLNHEKIEKFYQDILNSFANKEFYKNQACRYLKSARELMNLNNSYLEQATNIQKLFKMSEDVSSQIFLEEKYKNSIIKKFFAEKFSSKGLVDNSILILNGYTIYSTDRALGYCLKIFMKQIVRQAQMKGYDLEVYYSTFDNELIKHILIPELKIAITQNKIKNSCIIPLSSCLDVTELTKHQNDIFDNKKIISSILELASKSFEKAYAENKLINDIYSQDVDMEDIVSKINITLT